jgi:hypothetical protein
LLSIPVYSATGTSPLAGIRSGLPNAADCGRVLRYIGEEVPMSLLPFAASVLAAAGLLALFLPSKQILLLSIAFAAGIVADTLVDWWTPRNAPGEVYQIKYVLAVLPPLCALAAILGYLWPRKAWQWGLVPFFAVALWNVAGPYSTVRWGNLGPIPYVYPFYVAAWMAIPAIIAAELAAYIARRRARSGGAGA